MHDLPVSHGGQSMYLVLTRDGMTKVLLRIR
jgi:hypothetical protein